MRPYKYIMKNKVVFVFINCLLFLFASSVYADAPKISIIIDDLGNTPAASMRVAHLPGPVVCSILPRLPFSVSTANLCRGAQKEVMLHAPMQAVTAEDLGPGALTLGMTKEAFLATLNSDLRSIPYVHGLNNHMGSRLTASTEQMDWLMEALHGRGIFFVDSRTSAKSVAEKIAKLNGIPTTKRDVFLDDVRSTSAIREQFDRLLVLARERGSAVAIAHPYPVTLSFLEHELPELSAQGYQLVPISSLLVKSKIENNNSISSLLFRKWYHILCANYSAVCKWLEK